MFTSRRRTMTIRAAIFLLSFLRFARVDALRGADTLKGGSYTWRYVNLSTIYGKEYKKSTVKLRGTVSTWEECRDVCDADANCSSFDWASGDAANETGCAFTHQCWTRSDHIFEPKVPHKCAKVSGEKTKVIPPPPKGSKNVLFVIFDDLRVIHKAYEQPQPFGPYTPNTDSLSKKSLIFDRAYCQQAVCGPSRASLLSGRRPDTTQMWNFVSGFRQTPGASTWNTWPEYFKNSGYLTHGVGKLFHPGDPANFDEPFSWTDGVYGGYFGQDKCPSGATTSAEGLCAVPINISDHKYPDEETLTVARRYLSEASNSSRPFWLGVGFVKPHMPHVFPEKFLEMIPVEKDVMVASNMYPPNGSSLIEWQSGAEQPAKSPYEETPLSSAQGKRRAYYGAAAFSDSLLGELLGSLKEFGLENDTIIVMTADHGWGLGEHNHWIKYTNWETDARVPLLIHVPGAKQTYGKHTGSLVEHVDLYPTLVELAMGKSVNKSQESIEGDSYAELFDESRVKDPSTFVWTNEFGASFTQYPRCCKNNKCGPQDGNFSNNHRCASVPKEKFDYMGYSIRTQRWRYTEWAKWDGRSLRPIFASDPTKDPLVELYDHDGDTGNGASTWNDFENVNVAKGNPHVVQSLSLEIKRFYNHFRVV